MKSNHLLPLAVSLALFSAVVASADVMTLQPMDDSAITSISPGTNTPAGNATEFSLIGWLDLGAARPLLKFDLSAIPDGWAVLSAVLTLEKLDFLPGAWGSFNAELWRMTNDNWTEATVTWVSYDQAGAVPVASLPPPHTNGPSVWNISVADWAYAEDLLDDAVTFALRWNAELSQHYKGVRYSSKEGTVAPTLRIEYVPRLTVTRSNGAVIVSWPLPADDWVLEATNALPQVSADWPQIAPPYQTNGANLQFTEPLPTGKKFYRLHKP